jgi:hypothetical protein
MDAPIPDPPSHLLVGFSPVAVRFVFVVNSIDWIVAGFPIRLDKLLDGVS